MTILIILACIAVYLFLVIRSGQFLADQDKNADKALFLIQGGEYKTKKEIKP